MPYTAAVAGASGYAGGEVLRILSHHPRIRPVTFTAHTQAGEKLGKVQPHLRSLAHADLIDTTPENLAGHDVVYLALPHGKSGELSEQISALSPDTIIVDCGADHRLRNRHDWDEFYGGTFHEPWTYGVPELLLAKGKQRTNLVSAKRIAAPGCNASAVSLALAPGIHSNLIEADNIVTVLAVGPSGAGKALRPNLLAAEILGSASPYAVGGVHRHIPEIAQALRGTRPNGQVKHVGLSFTPLLVPMARGILATCTARISPGVSEEALRAAWEAAYGDEPFVQLLPRGQHPATADTLGANALLMSLSVDRAANRVVVIAALDNLAKGTAGAAVQSTNIALGIEEIAGLNQDGVAP